MCLDYSRTPSEEKGLAQLCGHVLGPTLKYLLLSVIHSDHVISIV